MCGGGKTPEMPKAPAPSPVPMPAETAPTTPQELLNRQKRLRQGVLSTIKTRPGGITGAGADLTSGQGKTALGG